MKLERPGAVGLKYSLAATPVNPDPCSNRLWPREFALLGRTSGWLAFYLRLL